MPSLPKVRPAFSLPFKNGDEILGYLREELTVSRDSIASRINKQRRIEVCNDDGDGDPINVIGKDDPRITYDISSGECLGLIVEPTSSNLLGSSDAPSADQDISTSNIQYTLSFYGTGTVDLSGSHTDSLSGTGEKDRVSLTFTPSSGTLTVSFSGTVNYAQIEEGDVATSYIPSDTADTQRLTDNVTIQYTDDDDNPIMPSWFNPDEGTIVLELIQPNGTTAIEFSDDSSSNHIRVNDGIQGLITADSSEEFNQDYGTTFSDTNRAKVALSYKSGEAELMVNGVDNALNESITTLPNNITKVSLGAIFDGTNIWNGILRSFTYYSTSLDTDVKRTITTKSLFA